MQRAISSIEFIEQSLPASYDLLLATNSFNDIYFASKSRFSRVKFPSNLFIRTLYEYIWFRFWVRFTRIKFALSFAGCGLIYPKSVVSTICLNYPILFYSDSPFWSYLPSRVRLYKRLKNFLRLKRIKQASSIIFQTDVMLARAQKLLSPFDYNFFVVPPAPSAFLGSISSKDFNSTFRILSLNNLAIHKNLHVLPSVASCLIDIGFKDFIFVLTCTYEEYVDFLMSNYSLSFDDNFLCHFEFVGSIEPSDISSLYSSSDLLIQLSDLESFSNNYMEAWLTSTPILASDRDFARRICGDSAVYVDPHSPLDIANSILALHKSPDLLRKLSLNGLGKSTMLPTQGQYMSKLLKIAISSF